MELRQFLDRISAPAAASHKGQNGKVLIIGGSDLFHAASQWSFRAASRLVDMTFYSSVSENNLLMHDAKLYGTDGVILRRADIPAYLEEVDVVLIGPGMRRDVVSRFGSEVTDISELTLDDWERDTRAVVGALLRKYPNKKWVIDAGALQVLERAWVPSGALLTPHRGEFARLQTGVGTVPLEKNLDQLNPFGQRDGVAPFSQAPQIYQAEELLEAEQIAQLKSFSENWNQATFLLKGPFDLIWNNQEAVVVPGGNPGLTKGGTGDVLAGVAAGLWATADVFASAVMASYINKYAAHELAYERENMYNSSDLVEKIPLVWGKIRQ